MANVTSDLPAWVSNHSEVYAFNSLESFLADKDSGEIHPTLRLTPKENPGYNGFALVYINDTKMRFYHVGDEARIDVKYHHPLAIESFSDQSSSVLDRTNLDAVKLLFHVESGKCWLVAYEQNNEHFTQDVPAPASLLQQAALRYVQ